MTEYFANQVFREVCGSILWYQVPHHQNYLPTLIPISVYGLYICLLFDNNRKL